MQPSWLLDVHDEGTGVLTAWVRGAGAGSRVALCYPCLLHITAAPERLRALQVWLDQPEVRLHHGVLSSDAIEAPVALGGPMHPVLEVTLRRPRDRLRLARTIDDRGLHRHHTLLSVDVDPVGVVDLARVELLARRSSRMPHATSLFERHGRRARPSHVGRMGRSVARWTLVGGAFDADRGRRFGARWSKRRAPTYGSRRIGAHDGGLRSP